VTRLAAERAPKTVRNVHGALRSCLGNALRQGYLPTNPAAEIKLPRVRVREQQVLTVAELRRVTDAMPTERDRLAVLVLGYCGIRSGELWALRKKDVDLLGRRLHVRCGLKEISGQLVFGETKTHQARAVGLPAFLVDELTGYLDSLPGGADALAFPSPKGHPQRHGDWYKKNFKPTVKAAVPEKDELRAHDLRHTCASILVQAGANVKHVSKRLGHSSVQTTLDRYSHLLPDDEDALVATLEGLHAAAAERDNLVALPV